MVLGILGGAIVLHRVMKSDGDVVLDSFNMLYSDEDQKEIKRIFWDLYYEELEF